MAMKTQISLKRGLPKRRNSTASGKRGNGFCVRGFGSHVVDDKAGIRARSEEFAVLARPIEGVAPIACATGGGALFLDVMVGQYFVNEENGEARKLCDAQQPIRLLML